MLFRWQLDNTYNGVRAINRQKGDPGPSAENWGFGMEWERLGAGGQRNVKAHEETDSHRYPRKQASTSNLMKMFFVFWGVF